MPILKPVTASPGAPQQHKQPSRKGKKAWRKNVDVTDVQEGLEEVRDQVAKGGVIAEKASSELFSLDTSGDISIPKKYLKETKPLKSDEIIAQRSVVPAVLLRKRPGSRTTDGITEQKRQRVSYVSHKELNRLRSIANGHRDSDTAIVEVGDAAFDPWDVQRDIAAQAIDSKFSFLPKAQKTRAPKTITRQPLSLAANGKAVPAVKRPEGGYSYNPLLEDYEARLEAETAKEVAAETLRREIAEAERVKAEAIAKSGAEADAAEARAALSEFDEDSAWEGFESGVSGGEEEWKLSEKRPGRKTQVQRNKIKRRKEEERKAKMAAAIKRKNEQTSQLKELTRAMREKAAQVAVRSAFDEGEDGDDTSSGDDGELRRRQLGKMKLPQRDLELVLPEELEESLRRLKPEGNLLRDRYRSLVVRGRMENRRKIAFHKRKETKVTEKWTHKDFMLH